MAKTSSRSFNQYSGIDRHQQMQGMPSATERLQNPAQFGTGRPGDVAMRSAAPWAMGLSERTATSSGRSFYDPARQAERVIRGTGRPGQLQGAMILDNINQARQDPIDQIMQQGMQQVPVMGAATPQSKGPRPAAQLLDYVGGSPAFSATRRAVGGALSGGRRAFGPSGIPIRPY